MKHVPRIYTDEKLGPGSLVKLSNDDSSHLSKVMRMSIGDQIKLFNEIDGEYDAVCQTEKKGVLTFKCESLTRCPKIHEGYGLIFAIINPQKMHIILEKSTELGCSNFFPVITEYTNTRTFNIDKAKTIVKNAVEQCGRMDIPKIYEPVKMDKILTNWTDGDIIVGDLCDDCNADKISGKNFLIGPEGGFSENERQLFGKYDFIKKCQIGNNILRSETAAIAFGTMFQIRNFR